VRIKCAALRFAIRGVASLVIGLSLHGATPFTISQVLSSPFPEDLIASPHGDAVAWVLNASGVRNIWVARAPGFTAAPVTKFTQDDGQEITELAWKADASAVFFTRGGAANGRGEFPKPAKRARRCAGRSMDGSDASRST
jgi:hypothetical protein